MNKTIRFLIAVTVLVATTSATIAETFTWTGNNENGLWSDSDNWENGQVPQTGSDNIAVLSGIGSSFGFSYMDLPNLQIGTLDISRNPILTLNQNLTVEKFITPQNESASIYLNFTSFIINTSSSTSQQTVNASVLSRGDLIILDTSTNGLDHGVYFKSGLIGNGVNSIVTNTALTLGEAGQNSFESVDANYRLTNSKFESNGNLTNVNIDVTGSTFAKFNHGTFRGGSLDVLNTGIATSDITLQNLSISVGGTALYTTGTIQNSTIKVVGGTLYNGANKNFNGSTVFETDAKITGGTIEVDSGNLYNTGTIDGTDITVIGGNVHNGYIEEGSTFFPNSNALINDKTIRVSGGTFYNAAKVRTVQLTITSGTFDHGRGRKLDGSYFTEPDSILDTALVNITGGYFETFSTVDNTTFNISNGGRLNLRTDTSLLSNSTVNIKSGMAMQSFGVIRNTIINMEQHAGAPPTEVRLEASSFIVESSFNISGGKLDIYADLEDSDLYVFDQGVGNANITIYDGSVYSRGDILLDGDYSLTLGGDLQNLNIRLDATGSDTGVLNVESSGNITNCTTLIIGDAVGVSQGRISGGSLELHDDAKFTNYGTMENLTVTVNSGELINNKTWSNVNLVLYSGDVSLEYAGTDESSVTGGSIRAAGGTIKNYRLVSNTNITVEGFTEFTNQEDGRILGNDYDPGNVTPYTILTMTGGTFVNKGIISNKTITVTGGKFTNENDIELPVGLAAHNNSGYFTIDNAQVFLKSSSEIEPVANGTGDRVIVVRNNGSIVNEGTISNINTISADQSGIHLEATSELTNISNLIVRNNSTLVNKGFINTSAIQVGSNSTFINQRNEMSTSSLDIQDGGTARITLDTTVSQLNFENGSRYFTHIYETGSGSSRDVHSHILISSGNATVADGTTIHIAESEEFIDINNGEEITLMRANSWVNTDPSKLVITDYSAVLNFSVAFGGTGNNDLVAVASRTSYEDIGTSTIAKEVGAELDKIRMEGGDHLRDFLYALEKIPTQSEINQVMLDLAPRQINSTRLITHDAAIATLRQLSNYRNTRRLALKGSPYKLTLDPTSTSLASTDINPGTTLAQALPLTPGERKDRELGADKKVNVFARATTGYTRVGSGNGRIGLRSSRIGALFGIDFALHENILLGFTGSYDYNDVHFASSLGSGKVNSYRFGPYAMIFHDDWFFEAELTLGLHYNKFRRNVYMGGTVFRPESNNESVDFTASIGAGYDFNVSGLRITPRLNVQYQFYHANKFAEKNGNGTELNVSKYDTSALTSNLAVEFWKRFEFNESNLVAMTPFFTVGWRHEWLAPTDLKSQFQGGGGRFNIDNDLYSRNAIYLGVGNTFEISDSLNLDLRYQADLGSRQNVTQNAYISLRYKF